MATSSLVQVPLFTQREIWVAECCALALWNGISFETLKQISPSDEVLLSNFDLGFQHAVRFPNQPSKITVGIIRDLIRVAKTTQTYRGRYHLDIQKGISGIKKFGVLAYRAATSRPRLMPTLAAGKQAVDDCSKEWTSATANVTHRTVLTTRVLFFCIPEIAIYNFCTDFKKAMGLSAKSHVALPDFNNLMFNGINANRAQLFRLQLPKSSVITKRAWNRINKSDWWQRRVLDLALLIHHQIVAPHPSINRAVSRRISRTKSAEKQGRTPDKFCCVSEILPTVNTKPSKGDKPKRKC